MGSMAQVIRYAAALAFPVLLPENEADHRVRNTPTVEVLVTQLDIYDDSHLHKRSDIKMKNDDPVLDVNGVDDVAEDRIKGDKRQQHTSQLGAQVVDTIPPAERVPLSLVPKQSGYSVSSPALYTQYSSQPSSIGEFYYDYELDQDYLWLVVSRIKLDDMEGEVVMKDMLDNVFLSMSIGSSCQNSVYSCESVVDIFDNINVTLVSDEE